MANQQSTDSANEFKYEDLYEVEDHTVLLRQGIDLQDLCDPKGTGSEFEIEDAAPVDTDNLPEYRQEDAYMHLEGGALGFNDDDEEGNGVETNDDPFEICARKMENITEDGGVKKQILNEGTGNVVPDNVEVIVHYNGYTEHNDEPYDSTRLRGSPLHYVLGCGNMIPGLEIGIRTMRKNEEARFLVKPEYAFGPRGAPPRIPENATLLFQLELLNWVECSELHEFYNLSREERRTCEYSLLKKVAMHFIEGGKERFAQKKYGLAKNQFMKALKALEPFHPKDEEEEKIFQRTLIRVYNNVALCCLWMSHLGQVARFTRSVLEIDPNNVKALYFRGKAFRKLGEFDRARKELTKAQRLEPSNKYITVELTELNGTMKKFLDAEQNMCRKMFSSTPKNTVKEKPRSEARDEYSEVQLSDNFKNVFQDRIKDFADDSTLMELPLPQASFSPAELVFIEEVALDHNLDLIIKGESNNQHLRLIKNKLAPT